MKWARRKIDQARNALMLSHDYRRVFSTPHGRRVLADLIRSNCGTFSTLAVDFTNRIDPNRTLINEGRRVAVLGILGRIKGPQDAERIINEGLEGEDIEVLTE